MTRKNLSEQIKEMPHENVMNAVWANLKGERLTYPGIDNFIGIGKMQWIMIDIHYSDYKFTESEYHEIAKFSAQKWPEEMLRVHTDKLSAEHFYDVMSIALIFCKDEKAKNNIQRKVMGYFERHKSVTPTFTERNLIYNIMQDRQKS